MNYTELKRAALESCFSRTNDKQKEALFQVNGPVLIIAGAGSGKTTVLCNRIANMIRFGNAYNDTAEKTLSLEDEKLLADYPTAEHNAETDAKLAELIAVSPINPWNILAITFTNKAAGELKERLCAMCGDEDGNKINASTFHSACMKILRREIGHIGYRDNFTIYDSDDSQRVIKDVLKTNGIDEKKFAPKAVQNEISRAKDKLWVPAAYEAEAQRTGDFFKKTVSRVYAEYQQRLKSANALDFDDIIMLTVELFEKNDDVLQHYQNLYKYIMVDEYQDTNHAQYKLVSMLAEKYGNLCVVGDDDQSIYRFRGATIENILGFEKEFTDCVTIRLEQNYRSTENILNAANEVISHNSNRKPKKLWSQLGEGELVCVNRFYDEQRESYFVAQTIQEGQKNGQKYNDFALLYRTNAQSRSFELALSKMGIPYKIVGGVRFYERKEIKDILAYLSVLNNPYDIVRLKRIINEPKRGIGDTTTAEVEKISNGLGISPVDVMLNAAEYPTLTRKSAALAGVGQIFMELEAECDTVPLDHLIDDILTKTGYGQYMKSLGDEGANRLENINELKSNVITMLKEDETLTLPDFLEQVALYSDMDSYEGGDDRVALMTMHSAKGLEFDTVFLVGAEDNLFPSHRCMQEPEDMEEERRLAYVAITRAKRHLYVTHTAQRVIYGQTMRNKLSTFIREIPEELKEEKDNVHRSTSNFAPQKKQGYLQSMAAPAAKNVIKPHALGTVYEVGDRITHNSFGDGTVTESVKMANDTMLTIEFDAVGTKKLMANFARIQKIDET